MNTAFLLLTSERRRNVKVEASPIPELLHTLSLLRAPSEPGKGMDGHVQFKQPILGNWGGGLCSCLTAFLLPSISDSIEPLQPQISKEPKPFHVSQENNIKYKNIKIKASSAPRPPLPLLTLVFFLPRLVYGLSRSPPFLTHQRPQTHILHPTIVWPSSHHSVQTVLAQSTHLPDSMDTCQSSPSLTRTNPTQLQSLLHLQCPVPLFS